MVTLSQDIIENLEGREVFDFKKEQIICNIAGVKVGGNIGENPTTMIGSIFYKGDKTVKDEKTGAFDRSTAEERIRKTEELSERTGLPAMLDVVCTNPQNTERYLEFVADTTSMPLLIDAVSDEAAITGMNYVKELGVIERTILNSINPETKELIYNKIREVKLKSAILLTYSTKAIIYSYEKVKIVESIASKIKGVGVKNILVDTVAMDIATLGLACKAIYEVKNQFGYPAGCGAHNAVSSWKALKKKKDTTLTLCCSAIANGMPIAIGADFVLYGPLDKAKYMFPTIGIIDAAYGQVSIESGKRVGSTHPRFKIARF